MPDQGKPDGTLRPARSPERRQAAEEQRARRAANRAAENANDPVPLRPNRKVQPTEAAEDAPKPAKAAPDPAPEPIAVAPVASTARPRRRHFVFAFSFAIVVLLPIVASAIYLWGVASDQYNSTVGFSVRREETTPAVEILGGLTSLSGSSSSDSDILYEYIQSQEMVGTVDKRLDLRAIWSKPSFDPVYALPADVTIEELVDYWHRMVKIYYDGSTGLIEMRVLAFDPDDAQKIAQAILDEASRMINELSAIARADATRYASDDLEQAIERLKTARQAMTEFRSRTQIVDPATDMQGQMGLLNTLQGQLAQAMIDLDLLRDTTREGDPRIAQVQRRIDVINARIADERKKFGVGTGNAEGEDYATLFAEYERLTVDRQFAEQAYTAALGTYDSARAEAQRQSRYLAAYVRPTLAEQSLYPQRWITLSLIAVFAFLTWALATLIYYSVRDRA